MLAHVTVTDRVRANTWASDSLNESGPWPTCPRWPIDFLIGGLEVRQGRDGNLRGQAGQPRNCPNDRMLTEAHLDRNLIPTSNLLAVVVCEQLGAIGVHPSNQIFCNHFSRRRLVRSGRANRSYVRIALHARISPEHHHRVLGVHHKHNLVAYRWKIRTEFRERGDADVLYPENNQYAQHVGVFRLALPQHEVGRFFQCLLNILRHVLSSSINLHESIARTLIDHGVDDHSDLLRLVRGGEIGR
jgi:hypothetical protein